MAVVKPSYTTPSENHLVFSEGPCLVREEILDLPKVLSDVQSSALDSRVHFLIVEIYVTLNKIDLPQLHDFNGHVERNGNQDLIKCKQFKKIKVSDWRGREIDKEQSYKIPLFSVAEITCNKMIMVQNT